MEPFQCADAFPEIERRDAFRTSADGIREDPDSRGFHPSVVSDLTFN